MSSHSPPIIYDPTQHAHLVPQLAQIHADCVLHDGTLATFLPRDDGSMDLTALREFWTKQAAGVADGSREILLQLVPSDADPAREEVAGYVVLYMPPTETGPFRGVVEKLMVSPRHRRKGVAKAVMGLLEEVARRKQRGLLMLDTTIGSEAEHVYPRLGYKTQGIIPRYGIHPKTRQLVDEIFYYKDLRDEQ